MSINREGRDQLIAKVISDLRAVAVSSRFPLNEAVSILSAKSAAEIAKGGTPEELLLMGLLDLFEVTSISAAQAIKSLHNITNDDSGVRDLLVDLWSRAEAGRSLVFDVQGVFSGEDKAQRLADISETARVLAPETIAVAMHLSVPVDKYVEFAEGVLGRVG